MSFLFGLSATETHGINWPGLSGRRHSALGYMTLGEILKTIEIAPTLQKSLAA
jgi:hypothetical protein